MSGTVPALLVNGNLSVRGDVAVEGAAGIIHANGQMQIEGNSVCAQQYFSSTESISGGIPERGEGCDGDGELRPGSAPVNLRLMSPIDFKSRAEYCSARRRSPRAAAAAAVVAAVLTSSGWPIGT